MTAVDEDLEGEIVYGLEGLFPVQSFFTVDSSTGVVTLRNSLLSDTTQNTRYTVRILILFIHYFVHISLSVRNIYLSLTFSKIVYLPLHCIVSMETR